MTAGMGDVVIAPLYQALRQRGVDFEFFHRVDALHLDDSRRAVDAITIGRQVRLADGIDRYEPLTRVRGLPVFPHAPLAEQVNPAYPTRLESHFGPRDDVETRVLRRGVDFDHVVLAVSVGIVPVIGKELIDDRPELARHDHACADRCHPGIPDLAAADRTTRWAGTTRIRPSAPTCDHSKPGRRCRRRCGPRTGPTPIGRALSPTSAAA